MEPWEADLLIGVGGHRGDWVSVVDGVLVRVVLAILFTGVDELTGILLNDILGLGKLHQHILALSIDSPEFLLPEFVLDLIDGLGLPQSTVVHLVLLPR